MSAIRQHVSITKNSNTITETSRNCAIAPPHPKFESANMAPLLHYKMASHGHMLLMNPTQAIQTLNVPISIASRRVPSSTMAIDLNTVPSEGSEEPSIACRTLTSSTMLIDLNKISRERIEEPLPDLNQQPLPDLNQQPVDDEGFHPIKEAQVYPLRGQSHYLQKEQHGGVHAIDLNIPACEGQQEEYHEGNVSLSFFTKTKCTV